MEMILRRFAGSFILVSLLLAHYHSPRWLWFTAFAGFNLLQSSFTNFCPLQIVLGKLGVGQVCCSTGTSNESSHSTEEKAGSCCTKGH